MSTRRPVRKEPLLGSTRPRSPSEALEPSRAPTRPRSNKQPKRPPRLAGFVRVVSGLLTTILIAAVAVGAGSLFLYHEYERPGPLEVSRVISIPRGEGRIRIAERLEREGIIGNRWIFVIGHLAQSAAGSKRDLDLKAGDYEFKKNASMRDVLATIAEGKSVLLKVTVPEGLTSQQIVERLRAEPNLSGEIAAIPPEGTLLPETYRFSKGMDRQELLDRMRVEQQRVVASMWEKRAAEVPLRSPEEAVILASVVEKETGRPDERERVAAVFVNRLRKGMKLQSDPTIIYGIAPGQGSLGRPILKSDIEQKTPYNTYHIQGLPPTPICNPGRPAIEAALNPAKTKDLYFVADGTGGHAFSETLRDHNSAVSTWRRIEKATAHAKQEEGPPVPPSLAAAGKAAEASAVTAAQPEAGTGDDGPEPDAAATTPGAAPPAKAVSATVPLPVRKPKP